MGTNSAPRMLILGLSGIVLVSTPAAAQAPAHTGVIEGIVRDRQTRQLIAAATVLVENTSLATLTDGDGRFVLRDVPAGSQLLRVEAPAMSFFHRPTCWCHRNDPQRSWLKSSVSLRLLKRWW